MTSRRTPLPQTLPASAPAKRPSRMALALGAAVLLTQACRMTAAQASDTPTVSVVTATQQELKRKVTVVGTIVPSETTLVNVDLAGSRIEAILVEEGDLVAAGQPLLQLDAALLQVELLQNDAQKDSTEAQLGQAKRHLESAIITQAEARAELARAEKLNEKSVLSDEAVAQKRFADARAMVSVNSAAEAVKVAEAAVRTVEAARQDILLRLRRTKILAPAAGRILSRTAKVGAIASSSGQPLFSIAADDAFELEVEIPQSQFAKVKDGARARITSGDGSAPLDGVVRFVAPALSDTTRLGRAKITLPRGLTIPAGALATADIEAGSAIGIFVPSSAIAGTDSDPVVKIVRDNRIEQKSVLLGVRQSGLVHVRSGLSMGDLVVLKSGSFMNAGNRALPLEVPLPAVATLDGAAEPGGRNP